MSTIEIVPAILPKDLEDLRTSLERVRGVVPLVQIDVVDGKFAPNTTWPYTEHGAWELPMRDEFAFEVDCMIERASDAVRWIEGGASRIVVHAKSPDVLEALKLLQPYRTLGVATPVGVALAAHDTLKKLAEFDGLYDFVQVMGIDSVGFQGEPPDPHHHELTLLRQLRTTYPKLLIQVDGAVAPHVRELAQAGANRLVIGSAIVHAQNSRAAYQTLYTEANAQ